MGGAFRRIYFDLEMDIADRLSDAIKEVKQSQRQFIRDAIIEKLEREHGKGKNKNRA